MFAIWVSVLEELKIVDFVPEQEEKSILVAWVEIENDDGEQKTLRIMGWMGNL